jgi:ParB family transcriptional regulator, chromosome partitioning protein
MSAAAKSLLDGAQIVAFDPHEIDTSGRIGFYHPDKAVAVGRLLRKDGQRDLIKVSASKKPGFKWRLHVGLHRTEGAKIEGIPVYGVVVSGKPENLRELEASENLHRRPLPPVERAKFVFELCRAAQERLAREHGELSQQQLGMKVRWSRVKHLEMTADQALQEETDDTADKMSAVYGWQESAAEALDLGKREIRRSLALYRLVIEPFPDLAEALAKHPVVGENGSQLKELTQLKDEGVRRRVIEALLADHEIGVDAAKIAAGVGAAVPLATPVAHQKHFNAIEGAWARLGKAQQREFLPTISRMLTPEMKRALRDQLNAELGDE